MSNSTSVKPQTSAEAVEDEGDYVGSNEEKRERNENATPKLISIVYLTYYAKKICKHTLDNGD